MATNILILQLAIDNGPRYNQKIITINSQNIPRNKFKHF